jgi:transposase
MANPKAASALRAKAAIVRCPGAPDKTERMMAATCGHCTTDVSGQTQRCRHRYDHIDLSEIRPAVPRVELFGLVISPGAIAKAFRRMSAGMATATKAITDKLLTARIIASDETTTCTNGITHRQWIFLSDKAVLHEISRRRARQAAEDVLAGHQPDAWISDRYAGQQELGREHQACLAHVLHDVQYAIDCGDRAFAPKIRDHLRWAIWIGKRRESLRDTTLAAYAAKAGNVLTRLMQMPIAHPAGKTLPKQIKAWRGKFFAFLTNRKVPATNNISEREIRPSVVLRKVTNGFKSDWSAQIDAGYRSVTGTARLSGQYAHRHPQTHRWQIRRP